MNEYARSSLNQIDYFLTKNPVLWLTYKSDPMITKKNKSFFRLFWLFFSREWLNHNKEFLFLHRFPLSQASDFEKNCPHFESSKSCLSSPNSAHLLQIDPNDLAFPHNTLVMSGLAKQRVYELCDVSVQFKWNLLISSREFYV